MKHFENIRRIALYLACAAIVAACTSQQPAPPVVQPAPAPAAVPAPVPLEAPKSSSWTVDGYKKDAALWIYGANPKGLYEGAPPPILKSVVVLSIAIDRHGHPTRVTVLRSNGFSELDKLAVQSVKRADPLPPPSRMIMRGGGLEFTETWLFRDDGRFQLRTLASTQQTGL
jgi:protein TonB